MIDHRANKPVAQRHPLGPRQTGRQTKPGDFENVGADRNPVRAKPLEQRAEQVRSRRGQQPKRRQMTPGAIGSDDIGGISVIETVDLEPVVNDEQIRSEEHTSELQSLMRISYAVFCLKKKKK